MRERLWRAFLAALGVLTGQSRTDAIREALEDVRAALGDLRDALDDLRRELEQLPCRHEINEPAGPSRRCRPG